MDWIRIMNNRMRQKKIRQEQMQQKQIRQLEQCVRESPEPMQTELNLRLFYDMEISDLSGKMLWVESLTATEPVWPDSPKKHKLFSSVGKALKRIFTFLRKLLPFRAGEHKTR